MSVPTRRRVAALLEVLGIYLAGAYLNDRIAKLLVHWRLISDANPFDLLTVHATNAELLLASRQLFVALIDRSASLTRVGSAFCEAHRTRIVRQNIGSAAFRP